MQAQDLRGTWRCEGRKKAYARRTDTLVERCPKNTERGAEEQEKMRTQQLLREQKLLRDGDMMGGGRKEKTDVTRYFEKHSFIKKALVTEKGT